MYEYRESGLPGIYLESGFRKLKTAAGVCVAIEDVAGLHEAICETLINERPFLSGPEVRFMRKCLALTQVQMGACLGVDEQTTRRWEKLRRLPLQGEVSVRLLYRDLRSGRGKRRPLPDLLAHLAEAAPSTEFRFRYGGSRGGAPRNSWTGRPIAP